MLKTTCVRTDGSPVNGQNCVVPDNHMTTFIVTIRSSSGLGCESIKDLLQRKYEVTGIEKTENVIVVK